MKLIYLIIYTNSIIKNLSTFFKLEKLNFYKIFFSGYKNCLNRNLKHVKKIKLEFLYIIKLIFYIY